MSGTNCPMCPICEEVIEGTAITVLLLEGLRALHLNCLPVARTKGLVLTPTGRDAEVIGEANKKLVAELQRPHQTEPEEEGPADNRIEIEELAPVSRKQMIAAVGLLDDHALFWHMHKITAGHLSWEEGLRAALHRLVMREANRPREERV